MTVMTVLRPRPHEGGGTETRDDRVLDRLRYDTRPYCIRLYRHERLAKLTTRAAYAETLELLLGFYRPLDRWFAAALAGAAGELALPRRAKAPLIARDLADLGSKITALRFHPAPLRPGAAYALGWLYGVEMAGLGGRMMAKRLAEQLAVGPKCGGAFFDGYGADTHAMWERLATGLARRITSDAQRDAAREGAIDMLAALDDWLSLESLPG